MHSRRFAYLRGINLMSEINSSVNLRLFDIKNAPNKLSTQSAMFLPVQFMCSLIAYYIQKGGFNLLGSGSTVLMYFLNPNLPPILYKYKLVMKAFFKLLILCSSASAFPHR